MPRARMAAALGIACCTALLCPRPLSAFNSYPADAEHNQITKSACIDLAFQNSLNRRLQYEVRQPDWDETSWSFSSFAFLANANYRAQHHFDRCPKGAAPWNTDGGAFIAGRSYVLQQLDVAIAQTNAENWNAARVAAGRALHAVQDLYAHSNIIDLTEAQQNAVRAALFDSSKAAPDELKLTSFDPGESDPEKPDLPGGAGPDPYPHKDFSKDGPNKNAESKIVVGGKTKFKLAFEAADAATQELLQKLPAAFNREVERVQELRETNDLQPHAVASSGFPYSNVSQYAWSLQQVFGPAGGSLSGNGVTLSVAAGVFAQPESVQVLGLVQNAFFTMDQTIAPDGARVGPWWEVAIGNRGPHDPVPSGITMSADLPDSFLALHAGSLANVYVFDPDAGEWALEPQGQVFQDEHFELPIRGPSTFALGVHVPADVGPELGVSGAPRILDVRPSPTRGPVTVRLAVATGRSVTVEIFDVAGSRIRRFDLGPASRAEAVVHWDGRGTEGEPVPAGLYLVRVTQSGRLAFGRVLQLR